MPGIVEAVLPELTQVILTTTPGGRCYCPILRMGKQASGSRPEAGTGGAGVCSAAGTVSSAPPCLSADMVPEAQALSASAGGFGEYVWGSCSAPGSVLGAGDKAVD